MDSLTHVHIEEWNFRIERLISHKCLIFYKPRLYLLFSAHPLSISLHPQAKKHVSWTLPELPLLRTPCSKIQLTLNPQQTCL